MRRAFKLLITLSAGIAITTAVVLFFALLPSQGEGYVSVQDAALVNGGFEGLYEEEGTEQWLAPSWDLWYTTHWNEAHIDTPRAISTTEHIREGNLAQRVYSRDYKNFDACIRQQIGGITVGHYVKFDIWARIDTQSLSANEAQTRIGVDPDGGLNPLDIQYELHPANWDVYTAQPDEWQELSVVIKATSPTATLYACAHPLWAERYFNVYWDDARFTMTEESLTYIPFVVRDHLYLAPGVLANPDLEENWGKLHGYQQTIPGYDNVKTAPYWYPYWNDNYEPISNTNKQPEYGPTDRDYRVHSGEHAQQFGLSGGGAFEAGIYQVVRANISDTLQFSIWGLGWTQNHPSDPDPYDEGRSDYTPEGGLRFRVGIDPYGGETYTSTDVVWSGFVDPYDAWYRFEVSATAQSDKISVWVYAHPDNPDLRWNQTFWDDASLTVIGRP